MADVKWIKIVTDIFDDEKIFLIEQLPEADSIIVLWFKLLCLAGKQNNRGVFTLCESMPYTDEMFSAVFRRPLNTVRLALKTFESFGMVELINGTVTIPNWAKHQNIEGMEKRQDYMRNYMQNYREEQKLLANSKQPRKCLRKQNVSDTDTDLDTDKNKKKNIDPDMDDLFEAFWDEYPRKTAKVKARAAFDKLTLTDELVNIMSAAIEKQKASEQWQKDGGQYIPHPATWLNQRRWEDEIETHSDEPELKWVRHA